MDIEKIEEVNEVIVKYATSIQQYSTYFYFKLSPIHADDVKMDITLFQLKSENEVSLNKKLKDLIKELDQLNT